MMQETKEERRRKKTKKKKKKKEKKGSTRGLWVRERERERRRKERNRKESTWGEREKKKKKERENKKIEKNFARWEPEPRHDRFRLNNTEKIFACGALFSAPPAPCFWLRHYSSVF